MAKAKMENWEKELIREADAIRHMKDMTGGTHRTQKRPIKAIPATVHHRDRAATHVGFAKDRPWELVHNTPDKGIRISLNSSAETKKMTKKVKIGRELLKQAKAIAKVPDNEAIPYMATQNPNHQTSGFSTDCVACHTTNPDWTPAEFDHDGQYFPIYSGKHRQGY